jgi:cation transport ATPase
MAFLSFNYDNAKRKSIQEFFLPYMALAAHNRAFLIFEVTSFAAFMECLYQTRFSTGIILIVAVRATLVLGRFIFQQLTVFIDVVALITFINLSDFIVLIVSKNSRRTLRAVKDVIVDDHHIFLGMDRYDQ